MKNIALLTAIILIAGITSYASAPVKITGNLQDEAYIGDVPFSTEVVFNKFMSKTKLNVSILTEEAFINDVPFDTEGIFRKEAAVKKVKSMEMKDEAYIDDVPFDTQTVVRNLK